MELHQIETALDSSNPQDRLRAITELRRCKGVVAVPLLKQRMYDPEFIIRSFVAKGLGIQQTDQGFELLVDFIKHDQDHNVRAEAANSLAKYGERSIPYLLKLFEQDSHWLVRQSILAALEGQKYPAILFKLCLIGLKGDNSVIQQASIANLGQLAQTAQASSALELILSKVNAAEETIREQAALVLRRFDNPKAQEALVKLRQDSNCRVAAATLEGLV